MDDIKTECIFNEQVQVKEEEEDNIKEELEWEHSAGLGGISAAAARAGLYADHEVKDELVLGPERVQPPDIAFTLHAWQAPAARAAPALRDCVGRPETHVAHNADVGHQVHSHTHIHTEKQTYVCDICNKRFALKTWLMEHVIIHIHQEPEQEDIRVADNAGAPTARQRPAMRDCAVRLERLDLVLEAGRDERLASRAGQHTHIQKEIQGNIDLSTEDTYICDTCNKRFPLKSQLVEHVMSHIQQESRRAGSGNLKNPEMETAVEQKASVSRQVYSVTKKDLGEMPGVKHSKTANITQETTPYKCSRCRYASAHKSKLLVHERKHTGEKPYKCNHCSYASAYRGNVVVHERIHTGEKPYKCSRCSYASAYKGKLLVHERKHTGEKPYKCSRCSIACTTKSKLVVHERKHTGEKPYKCNRCSFTSACKRYLVVHERKHTGEKPYKCNRCSFASACKRDLVVHERKHTGEKPYKCNRCSYASARKFNLVVHKRKHTGEKPYKCNRCSYATTRKSLLPVHERKHTGEKPYKCNRCSYATTRKSLLPVHERKHTGEKPYKCNRCSYASTQKSCLLVHERKHTGEKPYKCSHCSYASAQKCSVVVHERTHTGEKPYKCSRCSYASARKDRLLVHERKHTG